MRKPWRVARKRTLVTGSFWPTCVSCAMLTPESPDEVKNASDQNHGRANEERDRDSYLDRIALQQKAGRRTRQDGHQGQ